MRPRIRWRRTGPGRWCTRTRARSSWAAGSSSRRRTCTRNRHSVRCTRSAPARRGSHSDPRRSGWSARHTQAGLRRSRDTHRTDRSGHRRDRMLAGPCTLTDRPTALPDRRRSEGRRIGPSNSLPRGDNPPGHCTSRHLPNSRGDRCPRRRCRRNSQSSKAARTPCSTAPIRSRNRRCTSWGGSMRSCTRCRAQKQSQGRREMDVVSRGLMKQRPDQDERGRESRPDRAGTTEF